MKSEKLDKSKENTILKDKKEILELEKVRKDLEKNLTIYNLTEELKKQVQVLFNTVKKRIEYLEKKYKK